jgi:hypothetical protein
MRLHAVVTSLVCAAAWVHTLGCEGETEPDDGKVRPEGNGVSVEEAAACDELSDALGDAASALACVATFRLCPELIQSISDETCSTYDEGSVEGCADYYAEAADCEDLSFRAGNCVPAGVDCP